LRFLAYIGRLLKKRMGSAKLIINSETGGKNRRQRQEQEQEAGGRSRSCEVLAQFA